MGGAEVTAGEMLTGIVGDLVAHIEERTPAAVADEPDAVHQLRTSVRRLRNVLAAFADHFEPGAVGGLRARLAEYGDRLGRARDLEVRTEWCEEVATEVGLDSVLRGRLVAPLLAAHADAHGALVSWAASPEARQLTAALSAWAGSPALVDGGDRPAEAVAREAVTAQVDRVLRQVPDYQDDAEAAHSLRKAARRLRHTADAVTRPPAEVLGKDAAALGALGSRIQSLLGDHRDALLLADYVCDSLPDEAAPRASYLTVVEAARRAADAAKAAVPDVLEELEAAVRGS
ncbi:CHAD domain-containing protein [Nocardioides antri]|uniref:CHAD domain-containing protein n=1 Tax=Nocardioides antri TaxID=2607659 RepID=A0A5B1M0J1_9ACTN|nr:CHAD domain-containing protein [Nocardioides antri]KAA1425619.1 CHAD domain-containing protein [Nocardioides antri]